MCHRCMSSHENQLTLLNMYMYWLSNVALNGVVNNSFSLFILLVSFVYYHPYEHPLVQVHLFGFLAEKKPEKFVLLFFFLEMLSFSKRRCKNARTCKEIVDAKKPCQCLTKTNLPCLQNYLSAMKNSPDVPSGLVGKEHVVFGNIEEIFNFHQE